MSDKITLDRDTFKTLASDTRIEILKKIADRKKTLSDLAAELELSPSTIKEHIDKLVEAELIEHLDRGTKWKYYILTAKGKSVVSPVESRVWILLSTSIAGLAALSFDLFTKIKGKMGAKSMDLEMVPSMLKQSTGKADMAWANEATQPVLGHAVKAASGKVEGALGNLSANSPSVPEEMFARSKELAEPVKDKVMNAASEAPDLMMRTATNITEKGEDIQAMTHKIVESTTTTTLNQVYSQAPAIPLWEIMLFGSCLIVFAVSSIYVLRRRSKLEL